jgi:hypothetical protein
MSYAMINNRAVEDFKVQCAVGVERPTLARDAFTNPQGAFDAMPAELSRSVTRGLDALSRDSQRMVRDYLHKRLSRDQELDDEDDSNGKVMSVPAISASKLSSCLRVPVSTHKLWSG